jgi:hypothetical protein
MSDLFKVVYSGELKSDLRAEEVIDRLAASFNLSPDDARTLVLGGQRYVLKKDVDGETAERYRAELEAVGLLVRIEPMERPRPVWTLEPIEEPAHRTVEPRAEAMTTSVSERPSQLPGDARPSPLPDPPTPSLGPDPDSPPTGIPSPSAVPGRRGWDWIVDGFRYFRANPWAWVLAVLVLLEISIVASLVPFVGNVTVSLLATVFAGGLMLGVREQDEGRPFHVAHLFAGFSNNDERLMRVAALCVGGALVITLLIGIWMFAVAGPLLRSMMPAATNPGAMRLADPAMMLVLLRPSVLIPLLVGALLFIPLMMAYFFAPALVVLDGLPASAAMRLSFSGCLKNIVPFLLYGLVGLVLLVLGAIPFGLGLLVVMPVFAGSIYAAYRDIYHGEGRLVG